MKIIIGSDHGGFELKNELCTYLREMGHEVEDAGCHSQSSVDYPDYAFPVCEAVAKGEFAFGILVCGTGIGMSICANKVRGIRCALCSEPVSAALTRKHNNANVLAMGARIIGKELAKEIVRTFLSTEFDGGRHENRVNKISEYEK
ncbi:MAG: ribose 5-phosphate isomerase B [Clostridia bacterium]|nr:ribose 5-phosphate isomerase B [Clostridia bacterium]